MRESGLNFILTVSAMSLTTFAVYIATKYIIEGRWQLLGKRLGNIKLNNHESTVAKELLEPEDLTVTFQHIGGLEDVILSLQETLIYPLLHPDLFKGLIGPPKGVLLYGPPGCGKTMLAKAIAKESGANFINVHVSTLTDKWFGESQKLVHALFTLARKLQPCIIFIDEIDAFMRNRSSMDNEATAMMKAEFMTLWDGLNTKDARIVILGATNRPSDIDKAILRRMPKRFEISLPSISQRLKVLRLVLDRILLEEGFDYMKLASATNGYSCSDLKELCRNAVMIPVRESIRLAEGDVKDINTLSVRPVKVDDFMQFIDNLLFNESEVIASDALD